MTEKNTKPDFIIGKIVEKEYNGVDNDLLTAGFGASGLSGSARIFDDWNADSLRKTAIYTSYKWLLDISRGGGFGVLYGPSGDMDGKIAGKEYLAFSDDGTGKSNVTLMVQIPAGFDPENPCIVTAPSSGSRGIYGAVSYSGEWALERGFAVAYTDKGTGMGMHDLESDTVNLITGEREKADKAGKKSNFTAVADDRFKAGYPHRIALKHAHSGMNPEEDWGKFVLQAIEFAFYVLNLEENFGRRGEDGETEKTITPENTIVIASGISNGGSAAIRAAEIDGKGLVDGVAVSEPNVTPIENKSIIIKQGDREWKWPNCGRPLLDYATLLNIYQPCASLALWDEAPLNMIDRELCVNRCRALAKRGLLSGGPTEEMSAEAQKIINDYGILEEQNLLQPCHYAIHFVEGICVTYANAYGKCSVRDNLCGFSFAHTDSETKMPAVIPPERLAACFGDGNGIAPTSGADLIDNLSKDGPVLTRESVSKDGVRDMNLEGALHLRRLAVGKDEYGNPLSDDDQKLHETIADSISKIRASGNLRGLPTIIVNGRNDAILPPNHTSRAYAALNNLVEGENSNLRYYEVTNAHHLDMLNAFEGFDSRYVPLRHYFNAALDILYDCLKNGKEPPPSQVVRTKPRGVAEDGSVPDITSDHLPPVSESPTEKNLITIENGVIGIPK